MNDLEDFGAYYLYAGTHYKEIPLAERDSVSGKSCLHMLYFPAEKICIYALQKSLTGL